MEENKKLNLPKAGESFTVIDPRHPLYCRSGQISSIDVRERDQTIFIHTYVMVPMIFQPWEIEIKK